MKKQVEIQKENKRNYLNSPSYHNSSIVDFSGSDNYNIDW